MPKIFTYGSLLDDSLRERVLGRNVEGKETVLEGYEKIPHSHFYIYPTIKKNINKSVSGKIFDVGALDLQRLDTYETKLYKKIPIKVSTGEDALAYIETPSVDLI
jgi:gamma-glutamylcyclotransferase (GGCT)/AIG2-like uncharacterized protein YtfP|tara:strand:+ start:228 stop:542 length:315 start_codon:yes stop_codon:yes gene_type:complete